MVRRPPENSVATHGDLVATVAERFLVRRRPVPGFGGLAGARAAGGLLERRFHNFMHAGVGGPAGGEGRAADWRMTQL